MAGAMLADNGRHGSGHARAAHTGISRVCCNPGDPSGSSACPPGKSGAARRAPGPAQRRCSAACRCGTFGSRAPSAPAGSRAPGSMLPLSRALLHVAGWVGACRSCWPLACLVDGGVSVPGIVGCAGAGPGPVRQKGRGVLELRHWARVWHPCICWCQNTRAPMTGQACWAGHRKARVESGPGRCIGSWPAAPPAARIPNSASRARRQRFRPSPVDQIPPIS